MLPSHAMLEHFPLGWGCLTGWHIAVTVFRVVQMQLRETINIEKTLQILSLHRLARLEDADKRAVVEHASSLSSSHERTMLCFLMSFVSWMSSQH